MFETFVNLPFKKVFKENNSIEKELLIKNFNEGLYKFYKNECLCGSIESNKDIILSNYDCIGIPITTMICKICGLIRTQKHLDPESLSNFYKNFYKLLYYNKDKIDNIDFEKEISYNSRSYKLFQLINRKGLLVKIDNVFEIGCSAGWNLYPYHIRNKYVSGCDLDGERITLGVSKGMDLYEGELNNDLTKYNSQDLVILSHVLEHVINPIEFLIEVIELLKSEKYLLVEIPSVLSNMDSTLITTFHFPHVYTFNENFLIFFFKALKLEVLYHNRDCVFILKKPHTWSPPPIQEVKENFQFENLLDDSVYIIKHLKKFYLKAKLRIIIIRLLELLFIKKPIKIFIKMFKSE